MQAASPALLKVCTGHVLHTEFAVALQAPVAAAPAGHCAHAAQGAKPVAEKVEPATQAGTAVHACRVAFQA